MQTNQRITKALQAKFDYQQVVNDTSAKNADGKREYYTTDLKRQEYTNKSGEKVVNQIFSLRNHQNEEVQFALSGNGILKHATYIHWQDKKPERTFLAKDLDKLREVAKDPGLVDMAAKFNWEKAPAKEMEEAEDDKDIELE